MGRLDRGPRSRRRHAFRRSAGVNAPILFRRVDGASIGCLSAPATGPGREDPVAERQRSGPGPRPGRGAAGPLRAGLNFVQKVCTKSIMTAVRARLIRDTLDSDDT
jgi:hypothetical protein